MAGAKVSPAEDATAVDDEDKHVASVSENESSPQANGRDEEINMSEGRKCLRGFGLAIHFLVTESRAILVAAGAYWTFVNEYIQKEDLSSLSLSECTSPSGTMKARFVGGPKDFMNCQGLGTTAQQLGTEYYCEWPVADCRELAVWDGTRYAIGFNATECFSSESYMTCRHRFADDWGAGVFFTWLGLTPIILVLLMTIVKLLYTQCEEKDHFGVAHGRYLRFTWELQRQSWFKWTGWFLTVWIFGLVGLGMVYEYHKKGTLEDSPQFLVTGLVTVFSILAFYDEQAPPLNFQCSQEAFDCKVFRRGQNQLENSIFKSIILGILGCCSCADDAWFETVCLWVACVTESNDKFALLMARAQANSTFEPLFVTGAELPAEAEGTQVLYLSVSKTFIGLGSEKEESQTSPPVGQGAVPERWWTARFLPGFWA